MMPNFNWEKLELGKPIEDMFPAFPVDAYPPQMQDAIRSKRRRARFWTIADRFGRFVYYSIIILFISWFVAQAMDRAVPIDIRMKLLTQTVRPGEEIRFEMTVTRHRSCEATVSWTIYDGDREIRTYTSPTYPAVTAWAPIKPVIRGYLLWKDATPGHGAIRITRSFACPGNFLHKWAYPIVVTSPSYEFEIVK